MILSQLEIQHYVLGDRPAVEWDRWKGRETFYSSPSSITPLRGFCQSSILWDASPQTHLGRSLLSNPPWERPLVNRRHLLSIGEASRWIPFVKAMSHWSPTSPKRHSCESHLIHERHLPWKPASERGILESLWVWLFVREGRWESVTSFIICQIHDNAMGQSSHIGLAPGSKVSQDI